MPLPNPRTKRPSRPQRQAEADVEGRKADVARAKLNLDYATIRAPIDGIVGAALASEGALVVQNDTASLATIQQLDPIYADFTQSVTDSIICAAPSRPAISNASRRTP